MQQVKAEVVISIPETMILVDRVEFETLCKEKLEGRNWTMRDLEEVTKRKREWLLTNILYKPQFKKELESFISYPKGKGGTWLFQASKMSKFLDANFYKIYNS